MGCCSIHPKRPFWVNTRTLWNKQNLCHWLPSVCGLSALCLRACAESSDCGVLCTVVKALFRADWASVRLFRCLLRLSLEAAVQSVMCKGGKKTTLKAHPPEWHNQSPFLWNSSCNSAAVSRLDLNQRMFVMIGRNHGVTGGCFFKIKAPTSYCPTEVSFKSQCFTSWVQYWCRI